MLPDGVSVSQLYRPQWGCIFSRVIRMRVKKKGFVGFKNISFYQNVCTVGERSNVLHLVYGVGALRGERLFCSRFGTMTAQ